jgi:DNA-binding transcriptional LysR family regulator
VSPGSWAGVGAVFPTVEVRHLHAVIALGEELNFTKAALRLHLTQSALSRQITEIEKQLRFRLFTRDNRRVVSVELTDAGRVFVAEARSSVLHMERAFHLARTARLDRLRASVQSSKRSLLRHGHGGRSLLQKLASRRHCFRPPVEPAHADGTGGGTFR